MGVTGAPDGAQDLSTYCREVEAHLCRRNGGHLVRITGPAFDLVKGWADTGVPLSVVKDGIDRTVERVTRKPAARRRPVHLEFCAADVLDAFDRWRRAVGMAIAAPATVQTRGTLAAHVDRISRQLTAQLLSDRPGPAARAAIEEAVGEVTTIAETAASARGAARDALVARLTALDDAVLTAAESELSPAARQALEADADRDLAPFRDRLDPAAWMSAARAARRRALRLSLGLPTVAFE